MQRRVLITAVAAVVLFWIVMTALLLKREVFIPRLTPDRLAGSGYSEMPTDTWMAIYTSDRTQIGYVNVRTHPEARQNDPGTLITVLGRVRLAMLGDASEMVALGQTWVSRKNGVREFSFDIRSSGHDVSVSGAVDGHTLKARVKTGGESYPLELPLQNTLRLSSGIGFSATNMPVLEPGDVFQVDTFDPLSMSVSPAKVTCDGIEKIQNMGNTVEARVVTLDMNGIKTRAWISDTGEVLRAETLLGFIVERTRQEDAMANLAGPPQSTDTFSQLAAVRPTGKVPHRGARRMIIRVSGGDPDRPPPTDDTQTVNSAGQVAIVSPEPPAGPDAKAPPKAIADAFLGGDPFVQTNSPRIREAAKLILGDETGTWNRAMRLYEWVYENIEKVPVLSVPSALDVLDSKKGDCNEHTVLYTALARAAGIPTRIAIGIVWSEEYHAFYYHAWPEVYAGRWYWVDPTLGQPIADATHVKLLTGGIENWWQLVPYLGRIQVTIDELEY